MLRHTPRARIDGTTRRRRPSPATRASPAPFRSRPSGSRLSARRGSTQGGPRERPRWTPQRPHSASAAATATSLTTAGGGESGRGARARQRRRPGHLAPARGPSDAHRSVSGTSAARVRCGSAHDAATRDAGGGGRARCALAHRMCEESTDRVGRLGRHVVEAVGHEGRRGAAVHTCRRGTRRRRTVQSLNFGQTGIKGDACWRWHACESHGGAGDHPLTRRKARIPLRRGRVAALSRIVSDRRRERTSQPSRWTREVLGRCCTRWLWRMVLLKSIGVRTSRAQRFETEGAPREVGAASTLLAQIELRERAVGEKTRRPKAQSCRIVSGRRSKV